MRGLGTIVNIAAVIAGASAGALLGERLGEKMRDALLGVIGLTTTIVGISYAITTKNVLIPLGSLLVGTMIGEAVGIERRLESFAEWIESRVRMREATFVEGFVMASLVFCVGPMAILGSINDGIRGDHQLLFLKSLLDAIAGMAFASTLGWGVSFSALTVLLYQGTLTAIGALLGNIFSDPMITEMTAAGGILITGIGLKLLDLKHLRLGNMLPGIFIAPLVVYLLSLLGAH